MERPGYREKEKGERIDAYHILKSEQKPSLKYKLYHAISTVGTVNNLQISTSLDFQPAINQAEQNTVRVDSLVFLQIFLWVLQCAPLTMPQSGGGMK
jgi:hypothetical protein